MVSRRTCLKSTTPPMAKTTNMPQLQPGTATTYSSCQAMRHMPFTIFYDIIIAFGNLVAIRILIYIIRLTAPMIKLAPEHNCQNKTYHKQRPKPCRCKEIPVHGNSKIPNSEHFINKEYSYCNQQTGTYFTCKCIILLRKFRNTINKF